MYGVLTERDTGGAELIGALAAFIIKLSVGRGTVAPAVCYLTHFKAKLDVNHTRQRWRPARVG